MEHSTLRQSRKASTLLKVAISGCCVGHLCDGCGTCNRGICCRRDDPQYVLPSVGSWPEPFHGDLGILRDDGDKVECHVCSKYYSNLSLHIIQTHKLAPDDYRAYFGLLLTTGLVGPTLRAIRVKNAPGKERMAAMRVLALAAPPLTSEQRSAKIRARLKYGVNAKEAIKPHFARNGSANPRAKLTELDVRLIRRAYRLSDHTAAVRQRMAARFGITESALQKVIYGGNWK